MKKLTQISLGISLASCIALPTTSFADISLTKLSTYAEECNEGKSCAEISAFSASSNRIYTTNAEENQLRILDVSSEGILSDSSFIDLSPYGGGPNSVATYGNYVAVAIQAKTKTDNGSVVIFDLDGNFLREITAGALPDMVTFTPNGEYLLVANEGEPNDAYTIDPEGSVTVILSADSSVFNWTVTDANFTNFNEAELKDVRIFGPGASVAQDLEPEYIAISADSKTAWISLQENNALAKLDIASATITDVFGLGYKKHQQKRNAFDASNKDDAINIKTWPTKGMYQPDAIATYQRGNSTFILSANEGDSRDYDGFSEEVRVKDLTLDSEEFPDAGSLQESSELGRLKTTTATGDIDNDGDHDEIYSYGARSFSIWNANGKRVYDSGSDFERFLADYADQDETKEPWVENRSDDKGPEPESITTGELSGETYAFIGLERANGIFIYNISNPNRPTPAGFINIESEGEIGPEGLTFIKKTESTGWLVVTSEISNTVSIYEVSIP